MYTVTGSASLTGYDNQQIDCWIMEHTDKGNKEIFWISKKTKEVLKLEQEVNGKLYRYKIKFGFSV
jgi:predicted mannosyl-3-phosphoglycerate phosphatase (HAD superfamily)